MSKTIRAETLGFCPGVRRAMALVNAALTTGERVATLGAMVHNRQVTDKLAAGGVGIVSRGDEEYAGTLVLRSHGVARELVEQFSRSGVRVVDGTCPKVSRIHRIAEGTAASGGTLVVVGDPEHSEVIGIVSRGSNVVVVSTPEEAASVRLDGDITVVVQTTFGRARFDEIRNIVLLRVPEARVIDSICSETDKRQQAVRDLAKDVDAILVIGGVSSANTRRLYEVALQTGLPSWQVETADELPSKIGLFDTVGIAAGASTAEWIVKEVEAAVQRMDGEEG